MASKFWSLYWSFLFIEFSLEKNPFFKHITRCKFYSPINCVLNYINFIKYPKILSSRMHSVYLSMVYSANRRFLNQVNLNIMQYVIHIFSVMQR